MNENTRKNLGLGKDWDPWFNHSKSNIPAKEKRVKESYYFIFDCETNAPEYISKTVVDVLGYLPEEITMEKIFSCIHPDDLEYCNECEINYLKITDNLYFNELYRYSVEYSFRLLTKSGTYITVKQEYRNIETDEYGRMFKNFVQHRRIDNYETRPDDDFKIIDKLKNKHINLKSKYKLTKRELEILSLINQGYQSKQISELLFLSDNTVKTHRKNILSKTESSSLIEAINKTSV